MRYPRLVAVLATVTALASVGLLVPGCGKDGAPDVGKSCETVAVLYPEDSYLSQVAKDCSTGLCLKPIDHSVNRTGDTGPLCTATCSDDHDCDGQVRDRANSADRRCITGFTCAIPFDSGDKACEKLCVCKDFVPVGGATVPPKCVK